MEAWRRCALEKPPIATRSPSAANSTARSGSFRSSPACSRVLPKSAISPSRSAAAAARASGPVDQGRYRTGPPNRPPR